MKKVISVALIALGLVAAIAPAAYANGGPPKPPPMAPPPPPPGPT